MQQGDVSALVSLDDDWVAPCVAQTHARAQQSPLLLAASMPPQVSSPAAMCDDAVLGFDAPSRQQTQREALQYDDDPRFVTDGSLEFLGPIALNPSSLSADVVLSNSSHVTDEAPLLSAEERDALLLILQDDSDVFGEEDTTSERSNGSDRSSGPNSFCLVAASASQTRVDPEMDGKPTSRTRLPPVAKPKSKRYNRKRTKDEVESLRSKVRELELRLETMRRQVIAFNSDRAIFPPGSQEAGGDIALPGHRAATPSHQPEMWKQVAKCRRDDAHTSMIKNMRLRTQYVVQLQLLKQLERLFQNEQALRAAQESLHRGELAHSAHISPFNDDFAIFASLGRDFDAQYIKIDAIIDAAGLSEFDGDVHHHMQPRRGENGIFYLEDLHSQRIPFDMHVLDRVIWYCSTSEELQKHHGFYEIREATQTVHVIKAVDTIRLPHTDATLTTRTAVRRYIRGDRIVGVWDTVIEVSGGVSLRLRERGWNLLRRPRVAQVAGGQPISIEQACVRTTPEGKAVYSADELAEGTLTSMLVASYHRHMHLMREVTGDLLASQFEKFAIQ
uniref:M96 mating-specific protein family n=1 Tax=Globisporangium ultimum (strain ATCC 200006 / CBS 805.95 / DAOM BR144) TaxID=431595 RepID=K3W922_GLOUD